MFIYINAWLKKDPTCFPWHEGFFEGCFLPPIVVLFPAIGDFTPRVASRQHCQPKDSTGAVLATVCLCSAVHETPRVCVCREGVAQPLLLQVFKLSMEL